MRRTLARSGARLAVPLALVLALVWSERGEAELQGEAKDLASKILGVNPDRDGRKLTDPAQIDYAKKLGQEVVCLCGTCPRHTVTNCDCGWAEYNRRTLQLALLDGKTREQIIGAYGTAFGLKVFPLPPDDGFGRMSYILPYAGAGFGLLFVIILGLRMRRTSPSSSPTAPGAKDEEGDEARRRLARELDDLY